MAITFDEYKDKQNINTEVENVTPTKDRIKQHFLDFIYRYIIDSINKKISPEIVLELMKLLLYIKETDIDFY